MTEIVQPSVLETPRKRRKVKISDIIIFAVLIAVIVGLAVFLFQKIELKQDANRAQVVSDKVIGDLQKRDGTAARALGSSKFKATYSDAQLTAQFKAVEIATLKAPSLDRTIVYDGNKGRVVYFIYKYSALKVPYYVRTAITKDSGKWELTNISGNADETQLLVQ